MNEATNQRADAPEVEAIVDDCLAVLQAMHTVATPALCRMDVTMAQVKAMLIVAVNEGAYVGTVAEAMGVGLPAASAVIDRLVHLGWLNRREDPVDRRRTLLTLTPGGLEQVETVWRVRRDMLRGWIGRLDGRDERALAQGMRALRELARKHINEDAAVAETAAG